MKNKRPALLRGRHFQDEIIVLCLRWYLRYSPTDLAALLPARRALRIDPMRALRYD